MMPIRDQYGIWRADKFESAGKKPNRCPRCKGELEYSLEPDDDEFDFDLEEDWELARIKLDDLKEAVRLDEFLHFSPCYAECMDPECDFAKDYGKIEWYDPDTNSFKLTKPLPRADQERLERVYQFEQERQKQEAAGQLPLL
jgi:hypothetical protein